LDRAVDGGDRELRAVGYLDVDDHGLGLDALVAEGRAVVVLGVVDVPVLQSDRDLVDARFRVLVGDDGEVDRTGDAPRHVAHRLFAGAHVERNVAVGLVAGEDPRGGLVGGHHLAFEVVEPLLAHVAAVVQTHLQRRLLAGNERRLGRERLDVGIAADRVVGRDQRGAGH